MKSSIRYLSEDLFREIFQDDDLESIECEKMMEKVKESYLCKARKSPKRFETPKSGHEYIAKKTPSHQRQRIEGHEMANPLNEYMEMTKKLSLRFNPEISKQLKNLMISSQRSVNPIKRLAVCHVQKHLKPEELFVLSKIKGLQEILLNYNGITDEEIVPFFQGLHDSKTIRSIELFGNELTDKVIPELLILMQQNGSLERLKLGDNHLVNGGKLIGDALLDLQLDTKNLKQIHLGGNLIGNRCDELFLASARLNSLSLRGCGISDISVLEYCLRNPLCELNDLSLKQNAIVNCDPLWDGLRGNRSLISIDLSQCSLTHVDFRKLIGNTTLEQLVISLNDWDLNSIDSLSSFLKSGHKLKSLSLSGCNLNEEAISSLSAGIGFSHLKHLDLSNNPNSSKGIRTLFAFLRTATMEKLNISGCNLSWKAGEDIGLELLQNENLKEFDISNNMINNRGMTSLLKSLQKRKVGLRSLSITNNSVGNSAIELLLPLLKIKNELVSLSFGGSNHCKKATRTAIQKQLQKNKSLQ